MNTHPLDGIHLVSHASVLGWLVMSNIDIFNIIL